MILYLGNETFMVLMKLIEMNQITFTIMRHYFNQSFILLYGFLIAYVLIYMSIS